MLEIEEKNQLEKKDLRADHYKLCQVTCIFRLFETVDQLNINKNKNL